MKRIVECARCGRERRHRARGLCDACYQYAQRDGTIGDFPSAFDYSMDVDEIAVDRALAWLRAHYELPAAERRADLPSRPRLTRGEKIAVLARRGQVPRYVAAAALGISGSSMARYLEAAEGAA